MIIRNKQENYIADVQHCWVGTSAYTLHEIYDDLGAQALCEQLGGDPETMYSSMDPLRNQGYSWVRAA